MMGSECSDSSIGCSAFRPFLSVVEHVECEWILYSSSPMESTCGEAEGGNRREWDV